MVNKKVVGGLGFPLKEKCVIMLAPSFIVDFSYPAIIVALRKLGFDKIVEVTYGAKMVNREYHKMLKKKRKEILVSSACPGIVEFIRNKYSSFLKNVALIDSPMVAMGKICKKTYPKHKIVFLSPCNFKKIEATKTKFVDYVIDFKELKNLFDENKIKLSKVKVGTDQFDKFYNDYTKVYPLAGGLSKTANLKNILTKKECFCADGVGEFLKFLLHPKEGVKFVDVTFCEGGCIGGPCVNSKKSIRTKRRKVLKYMKLAKREDIPDVKRGLVSKSKGIKFSK